MSKILLGIICGIVFGCISVATMIPLEMKNKRMSMAGAFVNRFSIGFVIGASNLALAGWLSGFLFGVLLSLPGAIITKAWIPIMTLGMAGGVVVGFVIGTWGV